MPYMEDVVSRLIPRIALIMTDLGMDKLRYDLDEEKFMEFEINDPFMERFILYFADLFNQYKLTLTENNYGYLVLLALDYVVAVFEKKVMTKKFTLLGGIQFGREIKMLVDFFAKDVQISVRHKFSRLTQMVSLLQMEKVQDVLEIWGEKSTINWKLSTQEVTTILERRIDFSKAEIEKLNFQPHTQVVSGVNLTIQTN